MGDACASRALEVASVIAERVRARSAIGKPADGQPVASELSILPFDVSACCHVRIIAATATLARVQRACQAFSARVHVFVCMASAASAGMAVAGASPVRDMPNCSLCNSFLCGTKRAACILCCAAVRRPYGVPLRRRHHLCTSSLKIANAVRTARGTQRILIPHAKQPTKAQGACSRKRERTSLC